MMLMDTLQTATETAPHSLRDYILLADGQRGALLNPDGEIAWLCFPLWSDPALFAQILGSGGTYSLRPVARHVHGGYYESGSLIWRQRWITDDGVVEVREALAYPATEHRAVVLRRVIAVERPVEMLAQLEIAPDYGRRLAGPWRPHRGSWVLDSERTCARWTVASERVSASDGRAGLAARLEARPGAPLDLVLELGDGDLGGDGAPDPAELWQQTETAWSAAVPTCRDIPAGADARRSFAVLRGLTNPAGASVAAATTALPERAEAGRNYDYRYAWIRDTCYIGHAGAAVPGGEATLDDAVRWVSGRLLADGDRTQPAYCVDASPVPATGRLGLPGYPGGSDQVGNRVRSQFQLDLFGEALLLLAKAAAKDRLDADGWRAAEVAIEAIGSRHREPEAGVWEIDPDRWTHSRLICVAGLRAMAQHGAPDRWRTIALSLADRLLSDADRTSLHRSGRWQRSPSDERVDASLLLAEVRGAVPAKDPRSTATRRAVLTDLCQDDYLYRYAEPGTRLGDNEGAFLICNFWMSLACLQAGEVTAAAQWFERTRASCSTSGLFSEEYDVAQRQLRGNIPQAFVHALLIETAAALGHA